LTREITQQPLLGLVAGLQNADPAPPFEDGPTGLVRADDPRAIRRNIYDQGTAAGSDHAVVVADLAVT
jgi:hypothetical protein